MVAVINCLTFIFAGFAVFSRLGHTAYVTNKDVGVVTSSGAGFAFVAYPDGISRLPRLACVGLPLLLRAAHAWNRLSVVNDGDRHFRRL